MWCRRTATRGTTRWHHRWARAKRPTDDGTRHHRNAAHGTQETSMTTIPAKQSVPLGADRPYWERYTHAGHFRSNEAEFDAVKLGMWLFLATEVLLFGGMFCAY